ncbi:MAG: alpha/beta hydrolase, partial [Proteobacteria bacterium]|nr:alpha/beta hydrolase [Pseudomonadota bacterium]
MMRRTSTWSIALVVWTCVLAACSDIVEKTDIPYDPRFGVAVLDTYSPPPAETPRPAVLVVHGGGWAEGVGRSSMAPYARRLAEAGYVTVNIDYRLTPNGGQFPHAVQDVFCALAWMRNHATELGIDPARIAGLGYSAGGHLVSMLGTAAADPIVAADCAEGMTGPLAAVVSGAGPADMAALPQVSAVIDFVGGTLAAVPERYAQASPITHVSSGSPPFLLISGGSDWFVDFDAQTVAMRDALDAVGVPTRLLEIPGGGHVWNRGADGGSWELPSGSLDSPAAQAALV